MKIKLLITLLVLGAGFYLFRGQLPGVYSLLSSKLPAVAEQFAEVQKQIENTVNAPGPLRLERGSDSSFLTAQGTADWTNQHRQENGLPALKTNAKLAQAAGLKVSDMFARQFFAHVAPDGQDAAALITKSGYAYVSVGENLALGNYETDQVLVQAWMDSPGHRANILNGTYQEIGIAVKKGLFEGKTTWLGVQMFGKPVSACPAIDQNLKKQADQNNSLIEELRDALDERRAELKKMEQEQNPEHQQKVEEYNRLVAEYNRLIELNKTLVEQYNAQVAAFNSCAKS